MDVVAEQYEAFPYPARDPAEEARRLVEGSPSHPLEIDHVLFEGVRDWTRPFRALVAGGGTGDGLVMLAQKLADIRCPAEITWLDRSAAARAVAEARMAARGLSARFVTGDISEAPALGPFDYVDCCGVIHHLEDPGAGLAALSGALAPGGGMGLMVYAPHGRSGVYPLQEAFRTLFGADPPETRVALARAVLETVPEAHVFRRNPLVGDHRESDAGFHDLLLHGRDRPFTVAELDAALAEAGLARVSFVEPARYDPAQYLPATPAHAERLARLDEGARAALAERLNGAMKTHVLYAARAGEGPRRPAGPSRPGARPHLKGVAAGALAHTVAAGKGVRITCGGVEHRVTLPRETAPLLRLVDGRRTLGEIAAAASLDWIAFSAVWGPAQAALAGFNLLNYSRGARP